MPRGVTFTRRQAVTGLALAGATVINRPKIAAAAKKQYDLKPKKIADGVWMIEGVTEYFTEENGGAIVNCVLIETNDGMVVIDTGTSLRYGQALRDVAFALNPRGIAAAINTHHHPDHFFGNQVFSDKPIFALAGTKKLAETEGDDFSDNMYRLLGDWMRGTEVVPPTNVISSSSIEIGGRAFTVFPLEGHTSSDLALLDKKTGTLVTGDLAFLDRAPTTPHADLAKWQDAIESLKQVNASGVVPGHGPFDTSGQSFQQTSDYLTWLDKTFRQCAAEGLDMVEILDKDIPIEFRAMGAMPQEFHRSISHLYPGIERQVMPLVNQ